jgi:hypothetical protein
MANKRVQATLYSAPDPRRYGKESMEKMNEVSAKEGFFSIYLQAALATLLINFLHKIVRELPYSLGLLGRDAVTGIPSIITTVILLFAILLLLLKSRWGLVLGIIPAIWAITQGFISHAILGHPFKDGIWWYSIFPFAQGVFIIYFSYKAWNYTKAKPETV